MKKPYEIGNITNIAGSNTDYSVEINNIQHSSMPEQANKSTIAIYDSDKNKVEILDQKCNGTIKHLPGGLDKLKDEIKRRIKYLKSKKILN